MQVSALALIQATVEPGHDLVAQLKRLGLEPSPWASEHHGFRAMHTTRVAGQPTDSIVFSVETLAPDKFYIYFCGYQVVLSTTQHLVRDLKRVMEELRSHALAARSLKEFTAWLVSNYKAGFRPAMVSSYFKITRENR